ncbi:carbohydrate ABC transporter permease [Streptomyces radicis]|uniref:Carbohydrate ABC transporter permease n=1 Tax=Streptomyces radicis TaxID=1750517 RepID=A0A3A9VT25_9ACTN|nr:carbohydrate ABC transporter permease [Streptomyces radicis]RKN14749.1 carbohydrate ABC transporter permease [Streptomyces radicis]
MATDRAPRPRPAWVSQILLTVVLLCYLFPFVWMVATALKPADEIFRKPPTLVGSRLEWANFAGALDHLPLWRLLWNSVFTSALGALLVVVVSVPAAYAFARLRFRGSNALFVCFLGTLMVPQEVIVTPMFLLTRELGWDNSYQALVLPWAFTAFGTFLLRQFFRTIPVELEEAAMLDGASRPRVLWSVIVPIARPAIAVLAVFTFLTYWNSFLWPLVIVSSMDMATVPLGLQMFLGQSGNRWDLLMAAATLAVVPMVVVVLLLQRHLVRGIALSGLGGR